MKLRFQLQERTFTANINPTICLGTESNTVPDSLQVYVDNVLQPSIIPTGLFDVYLLDIPFVNIWDSKDVRIVVVKDGYNTFDKTFKVFGYDLGNDLGNDISENPEFVIILIKTTYDNTPHNTEPIRLAYSSIIQYREPLSGTLYVYKGDSSEGTVNYIKDSGEGLNVGADFVYSDCTLFNLEQLTVIVEFAKCCCDSPVVVSECMSPVVPILAYQFNINHFTSIVTDSCDANSINILTQNKSIVNVDLSKVGCYWVNDTKVSTITALKVSQLLYGVGTVVEGDKILGYNIDNLTTNLTIEHSANNVTHGGAVVDACNVIVNPTTDLPINWEFETTEEGDYLLVTSISIPDSNQVDSYVYLCTNYTTIDSEHWFEVKKNSNCPSYDVYNKSFDDVVLDVFKLNDDKEFELYHQENILKCSVKTITFADDGVYKFQVVKDVNSVEDTFIYIVITYCNIDICRREYLKSLICNGKDKCLEKDVYNYNSLELHVETLYSLINEEYIDNYRYEMLDLPKIDALYTISQLIDRINNEYCLDCVKPNIRNTTIRVTNCTECN